MFRSVMDQVRVRRVGPLRTDAPVGANVIDCEGALFSELSQQGHVSRGESAPLVGRREHPEHTAVQDHGRDEAPARNQFGGRVRIGGRVGELRLARLNRTSRDAAPERNPQPSPYVCRPHGGDDHTHHTVGRCSQEDEVVRRQHSQRGLEDALQGVADTCGRRRDRRGFSERGSLADAPAELDTWKQRKDSV